MKHLIQANLHKPEEGIYGDCHRTCIAMILGLERDEVPNFGPLYGNYEAWKAAVDNFLSPLGLSEFSVPFNSTETPEQIWRMMQNLNPGAPYIFAGTSGSGVNHSVVVCDCEMFDPSINKSGITGPCDDGFYWVTVYARWCR